MNENTFNELLDHHGANLSQWPAELMPAAEHLLRHSEVARRSQTAARSMERVAGELASMNIPVGLQTRILAGVSEPDAWDRLSDWFRVALWRPLAAGALPLLMGFLVGLQSPPSTDTALLAELSALPLVSVIEDVVYDE